jgi:hypothetical protein
MLKQSEATDILFVELEDGGQMRDPIEIDSSLLPFPQADRFRRDLERIGNSLLGKAQSGAPLLNQIGKRQSAVVEFIHSLCPFKLKAGWASQAAHVRNKLE